MARWGLRGKSLFILASTCLLVFLIITVVGWYVVQKGQEYSAKNYASSFTELNYQRILTPISREVALAERYANSSVVKAWLKNPTDPTSRSNWLTQTQGYLNIFQNHTMFIINDATKKYYFADPNMPLSTTPKYTLDNKNPADSWYFTIRHRTNHFNINVNYDEVLKVMKVWINYQVRDHGKYIGLTGTGFSLERFIKQFAENPVPGVTPFIINAHGNIEVHHNEDLIAYNSVNTGYKNRTIFALLDDDESKKAVRNALSSARQSNGVVTVSVQQDGHRQLMTFIYFPLLNWYVVTNVDLSKVSLFDASFALPAISVFVLILLLLLVVFGVAVERILIAPIRELQQSAKNIANGSYSVSLASRSNDEIGDLSKTFNKMAQQVQNHMHHLEVNVQERTAELEEAHQKLLNAHHKIGASIDYASLIQQSILPDRQMRQFLGDQHSVIWRPRDVVGGDFYVFHTTEAGQLLGVVDCAGHGVPGALMTMLMHAAIDVSIVQDGITNPAGLLRTIDYTLRTMLKEEVGTRNIATNADMGLVFIPKEGDIIRFSGAKINLYACNGETLIKHQAGKIALCDQRLEEYENTDLPMSGWTYYMTTDGFLDQSGGDNNLAFGHQRFEALIKKNVTLPLKEQAAFFEAALDSYMGDQPQSDDITLLSFRFDKEVHDSEV